MARTTATISFQAIELKGSLLPGSLLVQVARLQAPMQKEADYGLAKGERLRERIDAAWVRLKEIWEEYKDLRERAAQSTAGLHASARILREVLGWPDLQPCSGWQHNDAHFPITHRAFEGTVPLIVRGIAADQLDKGSSQFGQEGRRRSPHSCLQECLNADDNANWGLLLTGDRLRLLHDNPSLVKPAYLAVDLELLVEGELFDEFAVLWLLLHASRFRHPQMGSCVLDTWKEQAQEAGERVLGQLRNGVQQALEALGNGLLQHPDNELLRTQLASGALSGQELHRQLLRLVYRFLFLFTAEDRDLLFPRTLGQEDPRRRIYREGYSVGRLRELAIRRSASEGPYGDLWQTQKLVFLQLRQSSSPLGLPGLGGLFAEPQCRALEQCELANRFLLRAIRAIGWFQAGDTLTRVNYRDLNTEELGSVYEGLLELHPQLERVGGSWQLNYGGGAGSDRKTTGSYYTPDQLVQLLIVSALLPVIADRLSKATTQQEKEAALLAIRVLDPACGSGHFLLAAARRLALELARIRAGDEEPSEELRQECLREVVAHCIYGVDKNPMAVELCKVALWIEAVDPGKPLSFLDAHIQCGDSLVGVFDPKVLEQGIPDEAYKPLTGDDKPTCTSLKKENASFRKAGKKGTLQTTLNLQASPPISRSQQRLQEIEAMPETTLAEGAAKQSAYEAWEQERSSDPQTLAADLYTAAFFLPKTQASRSKVPTSEHLFLLQSGQEIPCDLELAVEQAAKDFRFFHWHLRFGEVMEKGGFDCILGNPPWEVLQLSEREFLSASNSSIAVLDPLSRSAALEEKSGGDKYLANAYQHEKRTHSSSTNFFKSSSRFQHCSGGRVNTYSLFAELFTSLVQSCGRIGAILPTSIAFATATSDFFGLLLRNKQIISLLSFYETRLWFTQTDDKNSFCLLTLGFSNQLPEFVFDARTLADLADVDRRFTLEAQDIDVISPNTGTIPIFQSRADSELAKKIFSLLQDSQWPAEWISVKQNVFSTSLKEDLKEFSSAGAAESDIPEFRGGSFHQYELSTSSLASARDTRLFSSDKYVSEEYYYERMIQKGVRPEFHLAFREIARSSDERTMIATMLPMVGTDDTASIAVVNGPIELEFMLLANMNSLTLDYCCGFKVSGTHIRKHTFNQLPFLPPKHYKRNDYDFIVPRVCRLVFNVPSLMESAIDQGAPQVDAASVDFTRALIKAELDAYYAHLYGLSRSELEYIIDPKQVMGEHYPSESFRVLKANELRQFGEYRTQRLVLEAWDRLFGSSS